VPAGDSEGTSDSLVSRGPWPTRERPTVPGTARASEQRFGGRETCRRISQLLWRNPVNRLLLALLAMAVAGALAACGGGPSPSPEQDATASPIAIATDTATATEEESPEATDDDDDGGASPDPLASFDLNQDRALEELLPDEIGGEQLMKFSFAGEEFFGSADPEFEAFLESVGATSDDVSAAFAQLPGGESSTVGAIRIAGADEETLENEFRNTVEDAEEGAVELEEEDIGGKDVWTGFDEESQSNVYFYAASDVLFFVQTTDEAQAEEVFSQLP
jgi:hypothetical protein